MYKLKNVVLYLFVFLMTACSSQQPLTEEKKTKLQTAKVNVQLGIAYLERNDVRRAKQKFLQALDQGPDIPETWYSMAYYLEATGNKREAGRYYLKAVSLAPTRGDVLNNYGTYLCRGGKYERSIGQFIAATKDPDYLNSADAFENAGLCARKIPNDHLANIYLRKSLNEDPNRPQVLLELADISFNKTKYKEANYLLAQFLALSSPTKQSIKLKEALNQKLNPTPKLFYANRVLPKREHQRAKNGFAQKKSKAKHYAMRKKQNHVNGDRYVTNA